MIVTVTLNPAIDKTLVIRGFRRGTVNRATVQGLDIGGKGINVAQNLARLDCAVIATGFLDAADAYGAVATLAAQGVQPDFVRVAGDLRVNLKILDPVSGIETEINESGQVVSDEAMDMLAGKLSLLARRCSVMVFSGSLPPGAPDDLYARYIELAVAAGVRTVLDTAGPALLHGLAARPDIVKPNRVEAEELLRAPMSDDSELAAAAARFLAQGAKRVVISLGAAGALSAAADGMWRARTPRISARNTVGAGDAMVAGLAYALAHSLSAPDALRLATALGAAAAASVAPFPRAAGVEALLPHVVVESVAPAGTRDDLPEIAS